MSDTGLEGHLHRRCGGHYVRAEESHTVRVSGMSATVLRAVFRCNRCGDEQYTVEQREATEKAAVAEIRQSNALLLPREIRALRERLGLTTAQLGELLYGVPKGLIEGWEKGRYLQNKEADVMLRSLENRETLEQRAARAGVTLPPVVTEAQSPGNEAESTDSSESQQQQDDASEASRDRSSAPADDSMVPEAERASS